MKKKKESKKKNEVLDRKYRILKSEISDSIYNSDFL